MHSGPVSPLIEACAVVLVVPLCGASRPIRWLPDEKESIGSAMARITAHAPHIQRF